MKEDKLEDFKPNRWIELELREPPSSMTLYPHISLDDIDLSCTHRSWPLYVFLDDVENAQGSGTMCIYFAIYLVISIIILTFAAVNNKFTIMARQLRKESATGIHHLMLRGINRQDIFVDSEDYRVFIYICTNW